MRAPSSFKSAVCLCAWIVFLPLGCKDKTPNPPADAVGTAAPASSSGQAEEMRRKTALLPPAEVQQQANNPDKLPRYTGPTGTVRGVTRATGDQAPVTDTEVREAKIDCTLARGTFGRLFREGNERKLADVLVTVTGYEGYVPAASDTVKLNARGCAWESRTVAVTFGQKIDISALDRRPYVPELKGQATVAQLFVMPGAEPVAIVPRKPGRFLLIDSLRLYNRADVFALTYSTVDTTGLDGKFEIQGIPVGKATLNAYLPATDVVVKRDIEIVAGQPVELELELAFDLAAYEAAQNPPAPAAP